MENIFRKQVFGAACVPAVDVSLPVSPLNGKSKGTVHVCAHLYTPISAFLWEHHLKYGLEAQS